MAFLAVRLAGLAALLLLAPGLMVLRSAMRALEAAAVQPDGNDYSLLLPCWGCK